MANDYNLFISYSTTPDYALSRRIESFLEAFHKLKVPSDVRLKPLQVCRDGSDFSLQKLKQEATKKEQSRTYVHGILTDYLERSEYLLLLCSHNATQSKFVNFEAAWFIKNKGVDNVLLGVTEGGDPAAQAEELFPKPVFENQLHEGIFYDFRGFKKEHKSWTKVCSFNE